MKVVVSANGNDLDSPVSPVFGRCPTYIFVDTETMQYEAMPNPAMSAPGGAGIQAAQLVVSRGAGAVLTGNVGPNALNVLQAAGVPIFIVASGTVREAVESYKAGRLTPISQPGAGPYAGMGGPGMGMGRGMGRGMGGGRGMGRCWGGYGAGPGAQPPPPPPPTGPWGAQPPPAGTPEEELAALRSQTEALRRQLEGVLERIEKLEEKGK